MKKSGIKTVLISLLIISLFLVSCQTRPAAGERPLETAAALKLVKTGTQGVELSLLQNSPPDIIYDQNELIALVELKNKGSYDLKGQDCFVQVKGFDTNIITGDFNVPRSCAESIGVLEGKNVYNTEGGQNQLELVSVATLPLGVPDYNPTLNFLTCYHYHTNANPSVCVDPLFYEITSEQKTCQPRDVVSLAGGQGGPVGVSYVGVDMVGNRAVFEINVRNLGSGRVLSPYANLQSCGQSLEYKELDKVAYNVEMTGGGKINCKPIDGFVRLTNGQGKIICSFNIPGTSAFETPLIIDLDYAYAQSYQKSIRIVQTPR